MAILVLVEHMCSFFVCMRKPLIRANFVCIFLVNRSKPLDAEEISWDIETLGFKHEGRYRRTLHEVWLVIYNIQWKDICQLLSENYAYKLF